MAKKAPEIVIAQPPRSKPVNLNIDVYNAVTDLARRRGISRAELVREAVRLLVDSASGKETR